jgi:histone deacetylase 11
VTRAPAAPVVRPRIVYSRHYNIGFFGLERLHPFDSRKYGRAYRALRRGFGRELKRRTLRPRRPVSREELLWLHLPRYLDALGNAEYLARALEVGPITRLPAWLTDRVVLRPMRWATAGTLLAAREAMTCGLAINLSGGYHHAGPDRGEGFCIYNDIALAVHALRRDGRLKEADKVVYIDCDAHQGNGVCRAFAGDNRVFIYDLYNAAIYPRDAEARRRIDCDVPLAPNQIDTEYLGALTATLPPFLDGVAKSAPPAFAIYNAGTDVFRGDPLGALAVTAAGVMKRDRFVLNELVGRGIPTIMLPSGGYTRESFQLIAESVADALQTWPEV